MHSYESIDLGTCRGDDYFLKGFVEPASSAGEEYDPDNDADNYGVTLVRAASHPLEENVQIVRMDTRHGRPHLDREYLPVDSDKDTKKWLDDDYEYRKMKRYLLENWKSFVDQFIQNNE